MAGWFSALSKTRQALSGAFGRLFRGRTLGAADREEIEEILLRADVAPRLVEELLQSVSGEAGARENGRDILGRMLSESLAAPAFAWASETRPRCILIVGVNGSGKTTSCAKLAHQARAASRRVLLGAADTYRAAGSEQLRLWAERIGCEVVVGATGADSAAAAYDALDAAIARGMDEVIIDTAGRMHTREPLMRELEKVRRALAKRMEGAPHETWIVLDASLGQNAVAQARMFHQITPLTGVIVSKLDGSSKAGFLFSVRRELGVPVVFAGLGENAGDLTPFVPGDFVQALLEEDSNHEPARR
ncbi:MAG: signal recognition particle-docking protein FtsY [Kiritimatiellia bacterium]|nr:signal recognition particle-docking protein FtsY [Kiritimatiellia bacterium]